MGPSSSRRPGLDAFVRLPLVFGSRQWSGSGRDRREPDRDSGLASRSRPVRAQGISEIDRLSGHGCGRLADGLAQCWMRMNVAAKLPGVSLEQARERGFGYQFGGLDANHMTAEQLTGLGVRHDLREPLWSAVDKRPAVRRKREAPGLDLVALLLCLGLSQPHRRDLGRAERAARHELRLERDRALVGDVLRGGDSLVGGRMGELKAAY